MVSANKAPYDETYVVCPICGGSGYVLGEDGEEMECEMCEGRGEVEVDDPAYKDWLFENYGD